MDVSLTAPGRPAIWSLAKLWLYSLILAYFEVYLIVLSALFAQKKTN
jgi:hypothetical protein